MDARLPSWTVRQRGAFAFLAILLLLVVVAVAIRLLLGSSQTTTYDTSVAGQSIQAYLLGTSGQERAVALLKSAIPNSIGKLDAADCSALGSGSYSLGNGSLEFTSLAPTPAGCGDADPDTCTGCDVQVTGTVASASRVLNLSVSYSSTAGVTGFGTTVTQRLKTNVAPSAAVFNLAYRRQMSNLAGGQATVTTCAGCNVQWDLESSSGSPSVGGQAVYDSLETAGTYTVTQTLSNARNYAEVGLLFSGAALGLSGFYAEDKGGTGKTTTGTSNTVTGETTNGAVNDIDWCRGGATPTASFADTLLFGFSGRSTSVADALTAVTFNCEDPANPAKCSNPVPLTRQQRQESYAGDMYSEIWVATNPDYTSAAGATSSGSTITVASTVGLVDGARVAVMKTTPAGNGVFAPGTTVKNGTITATTFVVESPAGSTPTSPLTGSHNKVCGGTCAFFDHTTNGNTAFNIAKSPGTTQWAAGFMCLKGVGNVVPIFQGNAKPANWYEPF